MRLFTGLDLAPDVAANIRTFMEELKPAAPIRWSPVENLHVTSKFIGEWPESRLEELKSRLALDQPRFTVTVQGLGFFPNARSPRIFWAGIERTQELAALAASTESALEELGVPKEERPYSPHLTLARIPTPVPLDQLHRRIAALPAQFGSFEAKEFHLYLSKNSVYTKLATFPLK